MFGSSVLSGQTRALACFNIWDISNFYLKWFDHQQFTVLKQNLLTSSLHGLGQDPGQEEVLEVTTSQRRFLPNPATSTAGESPFILPPLTLSEAAPASKLPLMIRRLPHCLYRDPGRCQRHWYDFTFCSMSRFITADGHQPIPSTLVKLSAPNIQSLHSRGRLKAIPSTQEDGSDCAGNLSSI